MDDDDTINSDEGFLDENDIEEIIELDDDGDATAPLAAGIDVVELENTEGAEFVPLYEPEKDDAALVFKKHTGLVFCVNTDQKSSSLAVTGGQDDKAYVWNLADGEVLFECTGHKDSVTCAGFSYDSMYVATADMGGLIKVWKIDIKAEIWSFECSDLEWLQWHHKSHVLLAGTQDGEIWMWKIPSGDCKTFQGHGGACNLGKILPDGTRACAGYEDGLIKIWDLKTCTVSHSISGKDAHESSITSMDCHPDNVLVVTGSTDVTAKIINSNTGKVLHTLNCLTLNNGDSDTDDSVEAVGFCTSQPLLATATLTGVLTIWDVPTQVARQQCKHTMGITRLMWDAASPLIYTASLDGVVQLWDGRSGKREAQWLGHTAEILDMDVTKDGSKLVTSGGDNTVRVFNLITPDR